MRKHRADFVIHGAAQGIEIDLARRHVADLTDLQIQVARVGGEHLAIFGMHRAGHEHAPAAGEAFGHEDRFGGGGGAVPHGGVGDFLAGEFRHQRLKFENGLQGALADFGLIGRVGGEEFATQENRVGYDRTQVVIHAGAEKAAVADGIFSGTVTEILDQLGFRKGAGQVERAVEAQRFGNRGE